MKMKLKYYGDSKTSNILDINDLNFKNAYEGRYFDIYSYTTEPEDIMKNVVKNQLFFTNGGKPFTADAWVITNDIIETWKMSDGRFEVLTMPLNDINTYGVSQLREQFAQYCESELVYLKMLKVPEWFCQKYFD